MKLLIVGSRSVKKFDFSPYVSPEVDTIISGGASGVDSLAEEFADKNRLSKYIIRPNYELYGRAAPLRRNEVMVDMADAVLVIWDGRSRGAKYTATYARRKKKLLQLFEVPYEGSEDD